MNGVMNNSPVASTRSVQGIPKWGSILFCMALNYSTFFFFNDNLEIVIRSLLVRFQVKSKAEGVGKI